MTETQLIRGKEIKEALKKNEEHLKDVKEAHGKAGELSLDDKELVYVNNVSFSIGLYITNKAFKALIRRRREEIEQNIANLNKEFTKL